MSEAGRPTRAEINLDALEHNLACIKKMAGAERSILAVVKADAYGHGAVRVARTLESLGVDFFGVATCEEGIELRLGFHQHTHHRAGRRLLRTGSLRSGT